MTYDITSQLALTGGLRYSWEEKQGSVATKFGQPPLISPPLNLVGKEDWDALTPRLTLLYKVTDDTNIYATYSQGFKSGLFNTPFAQTTPIDPEEVDAYEIGMKSDVTPGLRVNAAGFYYDYKDLQVPVLESVGTVLTQRIFNAASAEIWGAEINVDWEVTQDFSMVVGGSYLHAEYSSFPVAQINVPVAELRPGNSCAETPAPTSGLCSVLTDVSGNQMIRTPEWSGSVTGNYHHDFAAGTLTLSGTVFYSSEVFYEFGNRVRQPAYEKLNASAGWRFDSGVQVRLWGRNLTNQAVLTSLVGTNSYDAVDYERPREFGGEVSYKF